MAWLLDGCLDWLEEAMKFWTNIPQPMLINMSQGFAQKLGSRIADVASGLGKADPQDIYQV